ncbi:MAG: metallopeptidase TldD-related protein [Candidatus Dormibacteria bacterium]
MRLTEMVDRGIEAGAAAVIASHSASVNCRLANSTVTTNGHEESTSAGVVAIEDDRVGVRAADIQDEAQLRKLAEEAIDSARNAPLAPDAMPLLMPREAAQQRQDDWELDQRGLDPLLPGLQRALEDSRRSDLQLYGYAQLSQETELLGTVTGVRLRGHRRAGSLSLTLKTPDLKRSVWSGRVATSLEAIDVDQMYQRLRERLVWTENQLELTPGHYQVLLEPSAAADMLVRLGWEMHARGADEERTVFAGPNGSRVGEQMYAPAITVESEPDAPEMLSTNFTRTLSSSEYGSVFDLGLAQGRTTWIDGGVQQDLICPRRWAQDHGHQVRPDCENLRLVGTDTSLEQMIAATERALLITSLWYIRDVDPSTLLLTGLTRDGVFLIERGRVVGAVNNFRFNESPVRVLANTSEIGRAELALSREVGDSVFIEAPPIRVEGFFMSSVSDSV